MQRWVIGCTHFDDPNILQYRKGFISLEDMNEKIATSWETQVSPEDVVYVLGDFARSRTTYWAKRLPGEKILIMGNHDKIASLYSCFLDVQQQMLLRLPTEDSSKPRVLFLSHYPFLSWPEKENGSVHLHAHSHGQGFTRAQQGPGPMRVDMSVDCWDRWPVLVDEAFDCVK